MLGLCATPDGACGASEASSLASIRGSVVGEEASGVLAGLGKTGMIVWVDLV